MPKPPVQINNVVVPKIGITAQFVPRDEMKLRGVFASFKHTPTIPPTALPVDSTGNATVSCPMDGNDRYGDCGEVMAAHVDNIWTYGQGKPGFHQSEFNVTALINQYLQVSGGDNGMDESMLVGSGGVWRTGIGGIAGAIVVDALDINLTNVPLMQFCIDNFYAACMAWSVPDAFINNFETGQVYSAPGIANPNNGHYTPLADVGGPSDVATGVNLNGFYRLWTWGGWAWVSPAFVASVQPQGFVAFSPRQFSPTTGLDSKNRHIVTQAALWVSCGGHTIAPSIINAFPPISGPVPPPTPTPPPSPVPPVPVPPTPTPPTPPAPTPPSNLKQVIDGIFQAYETMFRHYPGIVQILKSLQAKIDAALIAGGFHAEGMMGAIPLPVIQIIDAELDIAIAAARGTKYGPLLEAMKPVIDAALTLWPFQGNSDA